MPDIVYMEGGGVEAAVILHDDEDRRDWRVNMLSGLTQSCRVSTIINVFDRYFIK